MHVFTADLTNFYTRTKTKKKDHNMYEYRNRKSRRKVCDNIFQHFHELFLHTVYKTLSTKNCLQNLINNKKTTTCHIYARRV